MPKKLGEDTLVLVQSRKHLSKLELNFFVVGLWVQLLQAELVEFKLSHKKLSNVHLLIKMAVLPVKPLFS